VDRVLVSAVHPRCGLPRSDIGRQLDLRKVCRHRDGTEERLSGIKPCRNDSGQG